MVDWGTVFDSYGIKRVAPNDKKKNAYVPSAKQRVAIEAAGVTPSSTRPAKRIPIALPLDARKSVDATYYYATRLEAGRKPEPRLGTDFISVWLNEGDEVLIGNIGSQLFAVRLAEGIDDVEFAKAVAKQAKPAGKRALIAKAMLVTGKPKKRSVQRAVYDRNLTVVAGAIARSKGQCEMPDCTCETFLDDKGDPFLEVHHIKHLRNGGDDTLENAAALCPRHHRELHHGVRRAELTERLAKRVEKLMRKLLAS
jgi:5-methylcytosine-specific restriction endonuclease McrA